MNGRVHLICFMGLPGCGKSYLATKIVENKLGFKKVLHISFDFLIRWNGERVIKKERQQVLSLVENKIQTHLKENFYPENSLMIVLDDNMYYRSMRYDYFKLAKKYNIYFSIVFVDTCIIQCLKNNYNRDPSLPTHVVLDMNDKLELPSLNNNWEKNFIKINLKEESVEGCLNKIRTSINNIELYENRNISYKREKEKFSAEGIPKIHLADLALRKLVSQLTKNSSATREESARLNDKRIQILESIKKGFLFLPAIENSSKEEMILQYMNHLKPKFL